MITHQPSLRLLTSDMISLYEHMAVLETYFPMGSKPAAFDQLYQSFHPSTLHFATKIHQVVGRLTLTSEAVC